MSFDELIDRSMSDSSRWRGRGDVLALTIGDSDFRIPPPIQQALERRIEHGVLGYDTVPGRLRQVLTARLQRLYQWQVEDEWLVFLPGVVQGLNFCCRGLTADGDAIITEAPIYYPFLAAPGNAGREMSCLPPLSHNERGNEGRWEFDLEGFAALAAEPRHSLFLLCNPQNPLGRVSTKEELIAIAEICQRENVIICSDEIHCDVLFDGHRHQPIAAIDPEIANNTVTLMGPSKAFGMSGLGGAFAIIPNPETRQKFKAVAAGLIPSFHALAIAATEAAYGECDDWLAEELRYLEASRDFVCDSIKQLPGVSTVVPEGTYFLWLDFSGSGLNDPHGALLEAGLELSAGEKFGDVDYLRLNFASPRSRLEKAMEIIQVKLSR